MMNGRFGVPAAKSGQSPRSNNVVGAAGRMWGGEAARWQWIRERETAFPPAEFLLYSKEQQDECYHATLQP